MQYLNIVGAFLCAFRAAIANVLGIIVHIRLIRTSVIRLGIMVAVHSITVVHKTREEIRTPDLLFRKQMLWSC